MVVPALAQVGQDGAIAGTITALDHSAIASGTVSLTGMDGYKRVATASGEGTFSIRDIPSGIYTVQATAPGFKTVTQNSVSVAMGRTTQLVLTLPVAGTNETVSVTTNQTAFDSSQTSSVVNIDRDRVEELPIPSRNYLTFVLLSPQVAPANPVLSQGTPSQGNGSFSFGGIRPGSNAVSIDGVNDDDEFSGGSRTQLSPEAISDFQIVNHGFAAQSGGASGGSIDVQTRSGLNRPHGDAFVFVQNGALNATQPFGLYPYKPDESLVRAGVALGGAIQPDKTFYYVAAEQELARGEDANDLKPSTIAQINSALQHVGPLQGTTLQTGFIQTTDQETELSGRIDRVLTPNQTAILRYAFTNTRSVNDAFNTDELSDRTARGSFFTSDNSLNGTLTSTLQDSFLNKLSFQLAQRRAVERTVDSTTPGVLIPGVALFGTPYQGNSRRFETHLELEDYFLVQRGHHTLQAGAGLDHISLRAELSDGFRGFFVFSDLNALTTGNADFFTQSFGNPATNFSESRIKAYVQDHWTPHSNLVLDLGVRYEVNLLPSNLPLAALNFSPRVGLAWTPRPSLVVRSGCGIFYDRYLLSTINRLLEFDGTRAFSQIVEDAAAATLYRSGIALAQPLPGIAPSIWRAQQNLSNPYSEVASFSVEQTLPLQTTLTGEYQFVHGVKLGRSSNINLEPPVILTSQNAAALGISSPTAQQLGRPVFSPARVNPAFDAINLFATAANSSYNGATVTLNRQFQDDFQILAGYTFSKTIDDASSDTEQPQNPFAPRDERSLSLQDQRHRFTLSGLWLIGPDLNDQADAVANANPGALMRILTGLEFAPILSITSGYRANPVTGLDSNREHIYPFSARPASYFRNSLSTSANIDLDLRVLKMVPLGPGHLDIVAESFNLLNHRNVSHLSTAFGSNVQAQGNFGFPIAASSARRIQFSLDYEF
jgi:outer membrane receptor protein involved in Fe transport